MTPLTFYRQQAAEQQSAADAATLDNVRDRCRRAASAWSALAVRNERADQTRADATAAKLAAQMSSGADE